jgi:hypothetical protein
MRVANFIQKLIVLFKVLKYSNFIMLCLISWACKLYSKVGQKTKHITKNANKT